MEPVGSDRPTGIDRIESAGARETVERIANASLLATGAVNIIGLDAIRRELGARWPQKAPRVWEHVERELDRTLGAAALFVRIDDVSYLIALPGETGFGAQAICLGIIQEVLRFFLGELKPGDLSVREVAGIENGEIASRPVDLSRLRRQPPANDLALVAQAPKASAAAAEPLADHAPEPQAWRPPLAGRTTTIPLAPPKRDPFDLVLRVEPVWNLRRGLITSFVVDPKGVPDQPQFSDIEEADAATFAYLSKLLVEHRAQGGPLALHVPVSFASLATQRSRERLIRITQAVRESMRASVLLEIDGLHSGVPPSRLIEVVGLIRSLCAGVLGRVRPTRSALAAARGCGLRGVVAEAAWLVPQGGDWAGRLKAYAAVAHAIAPNIIIHGLPRPEMVDEATTAGFTHASVAASA
jgi:hypothetical protein